MATIKDTRLAGGGGGVALQVIDYTEQEIIATANAVGVALASYDQVDSLSWWRVERIVASGTSANTCELAAYQGQSVLPQRIRDWTPLPPGFIAVAEYPSYLTILPGSCLTINVTGAAPGDTFYIIAQYQVVQKIGG